MKKTQQRRYARDASTHYAIAGKRSDACNII